MRNQTDGYSQHQVGDGTGGEFDLILEHSRYHLYHQQQIQHHIAEPDETVDDHQLSWGTADVAFLVKGMTPDLEHEEHGSKAERDKDNSQHGVCVGIQISDLLCRRCMSSFSFALSRPSLSTDPLLQPPRDPLQTIPTMPVLADPVPFPRVAHKFRGHTTFPQ